MERHPAPVRVGEQVLHLVEEEERPLATCQQALGEAQVLEALVPGGLVAVLVGLADIVEVGPGPGGQGPAELALAGPRRPVDQDVHPPRAGAQGALHDLFDMVARLRHVIEVRPLQLSRRRRVEQQAAYIQTAFVGEVGQPVQPLHRLKVAVVVDGDESGLHERRIRREAGQEGAGGQA